MNLKINLINIIFRLFLTMIISSVFSSFSISVLADDQKGKLLALSCTSCHGTNGLSPGAMPTLFGKTMEYIEQSMNNYKVDKLSATMMNRIAKGYTAEEIHLISKYFASLRMEKKMK